MKNIPRINIASYCIEISFLWHKFQIIIFSASVANIMFI